MPIYLGHGNQAMKGTQKMNKNELAKLISELAIDPSKPIKITKC